MSIKHVLIDAITESPALQLLEKVTTEKASDDGKKDFSGGTNDLSEFPPLSMSSALGKNSLPLSMSSALGIIFVS